jgi:hypothetical protein
MAQRNVSPFQEAGADHLFREGLGQKGKVNAIDQMPTTPSWTIMSSPTRTVAAPAV